MCPIYEHECKVCHISQGSIKPITVKLWDKLFEKYYHDMKKRVPYKLEDDKANS